jgi:hypothetical protein
MAYDGLTDPLPIYDPKARQLGYNNNTDRFRIELPPQGDISASGVVSIVSASGTHVIPTYLDSPIPVSVSIDIETDAIKIFSASGTPDLPVYLVSDLDRSNDSVTAYTDKSESSMAIWSASGTTDVPVYLTSDLDYNNDSVEVRQNIAGNLNANVSATDLDIRDLDEAQDDIRIYSASGSAEIETWINNQPIEIKDLNPTEKELIIKRFEYNTEGDISTIKEALAVTPSGATCKLQTFYYNTDNDVDYIIESLGTW